MNPDQEFMDQYVKSTCLDLSPPDDPGCCCNLPKNHEGLHHCGGCDTTWSDWNQKGYTWGDYGK